MLMQRLKSGRGAMSAREALWIATRGGAQVLGRAGEIGQITPGFRADLAIWDMSGVAAAGHWDWGALLLAGPTRVRDLFVEGRRVVAEGRIATLDMGPVIGHQRALARSLANRD